MSDLFNPSSVSSLIGIIFVIITSFNHIIKTPKNKLSQKTSLFKLFYIIIVSYLAGLGAYVGISILIYGFFGIFPLGESIEYYRNYLSLLGLILALSSIVAIILLFNGKDKQHKFT